MFLIHSAYSNHSFFNHGSLQNRRNHSIYGLVYWEYPISGSGSVIRLLPRLPDSITISIHQSYLMKKDQSIVLVMSTSVRQQARMKSNGHCNVFISAQCNLVSVVADDFFNDMSVDLCHIYSVSSRYLSYDDLSMSSLSCPSSVTSTSTSQPEMQASAWLIYLKR